MCTNKALMRKTLTTRFIVMLIVNTLAVLEMIYIFGFSRRKAAVKPGDD